MFVALYRMLSLTLKPNVGKRGIWAGGQVMKCVATIVALAATALPSSRVVAAALSPTRVFEGNITTPAKDGTTQSVHIIVQAWAIAGPGDVTQEIPIREVYVAHLISGQISVASDGPATTHRPGDYWVVKAGTAMQVKARGDVAVLETIVVSKQQY
jgi:uncharacterized cupin superfamily protein